MSYLGSRLQGVKVRASFENEDSLEIKNFWGVKSAPNDMNMRKIPHSKGLSLQITVLVFKITDVSFVNMSKFLISIDFPSCHITRNYSSNFKLKRYDME